jgi:hypothetical protein
VYWWFFKAKRPFCSLALQHLPHIPWIWKQITLLDVFPFLSFPFLSPFLSFPFLSFPFLSFPFLSFPFLSPFSFLLSPFLSFPFLSFPFLSFPFLSFPFLSFPFLFKSYFFYLYKYTVAVFRHTRRGHQIPIIDGCEPPCGCWELNSGPLEEQWVLLTPEPSLQPIFPFPFFFS